MSLLGYKIATDYEVSIGEKVPMAVRSEKVAIDEKFLIGEKILMSLRGERIAIDEKFPTGEMVPMSYRGEKIPSVPAVSSCRPVPAALTVSLKRSMKVTIIVVLRDPMVMIDAGVWRPICLSKLLGFTLVRHSHCRSTNTT